MDTVTKPWHSLPAKRGKEELGSSDQGLSNAEAKQRQSEYGPNVIAEKEQESLIVKFFKQFKSVLIIVLIFAAILSAYIGLTSHADEPLLVRLSDTIVILIVITFNAIMGFVQEYRAEKAIAALKQLTSPSAHVVRKEGKQEVGIADLVPGDLVVVEEGEKVPADIRLLRCKNLEVDESALTGESMPVKKDTKSVEKESALAERIDMLYMSTVVTQGRGEGFVVNTGMKTEIGKIAEMVQSSEEGMTPLQKRLDKLGKHIGLYALFVCAFLFGVGFFRIGGDNFVEELNELLLTAVSLAVAVIPEGLPVIVIITLAIGMKEMARRHAVVRRLPSVETLGSTTTICSDKTGTLTRNEMTVIKAHIGKREFVVTGEGYIPKGDFIAAKAKKKVDPTKNTAMDRLIANGLLCNNADLYEEDGKYEVVGDPTEGALVVLGEKAGYDYKDFRQRYPRVHEEPFDSKRMLMTVVCETPQGLVAYMKGAPAKVLERSTHIMHDDQREELADRHRIAVEIMNVNAAKVGNRVLGFAYKELSDFRELHSAGLEEEMTFLGQVEMIDPPRNEVKGAIAECSDAGINTVMITGDQKLTAQTIADNLGMLSETSDIVSGGELDEMEDVDLDRRVENITVYARASPEHKMRIISSLKRRGHIVAMTGDGVNDAPALSQADIGLAMGDGTDVAKEASDLVLMDNNFTTIVSAVEEGRKIYANIQKFIRYQLSTNVGAIVLMVMASLMLLPLPLFPAQILFINIIVDGPPAMSLSFEPLHPGQMKEPPRDPKENILTMEMLLSIAAVGIFMGVATLLMFNWAYSLTNDETYARTMAFTLFVLFQLFNVLNCRSVRESITKMPLTKNKYLIYAVFGSLLLQILVVYTPPLQALFRTMPLGWRDWLLIVGASVSILVFDEWRKLMLRSLRSEYQSEPTTETA